MLNLHEGKVGSEAVFISDFSEKYPDDNGDTSFNGNRFCILKAYRICSPVAMERR